MFTITRTTQDFSEFAINRHDVDVNQKYGGNYPYSLHLEAVSNQVIKYQHLLKYNDDFNLAVQGAWGHDLIEDARLTYNDIKNDWGVDLAEVIYACTENRGKNRAERHGGDYFEVLKMNRIAVYVKLADILANVKFGLLMNSGMLSKYRKEFPYLKVELYREEFKEMFDDLEKILKL